MKAIPVIVVGFGPVGQAFVRLLGERNLEVQEKYGLALNLKAVLRRSSAFIVSEKDNLPSWPKLLEKMDNSSLWQEKPDLDWLFNQRPTGVMVEVTSSDLKSGKPGIDYIRKALDSGWHVATADKGPILLFFSELKSLAEKNYLKIKFSGATGAALPALDIGLFSLAGTRINRIEAILNGTTNYILGRMEEGCSYQEALQEAQAKGIAEKNPAYDVEGWDTAVKLALLAAALFGSMIDIEKIEVTGINRLSKEKIIQARQQGRKIKLLGSLWSEKDLIKARVRPETIESSHPLFSVDRTNKGLSFYTDTMGQITVIGGQSDPKGAGAALLKDIINIYRNF